MNLDPKKKRSQAYCETIDDVMADPDKAQKLFELGSDAISEAIPALKEQGAAKDRRTAKMKDMKDTLRTIIAKKYSTIPWKP